MLAAISQFHFLRPFWLLMLIPCLLIIFRLWRQHLSGSSWHKVIAPELLQHLLQDKQQQPNRLPLILLAAGWMLACIALAGPSWQKLPVPVSKSQQPLVVVVDLSYYTLAADLKPNRLTRTRYKLQDLFRVRKDGVSAIVAYAGSAHTVAPLTDDSRTLTNLVKAMGPEIMPIQGNKPEEGIRLARKLLAQGSNEAGDILLITGNMTSDQASTIREELADTGIKISILGTGTDQGAPIPLPDGGYLKDPQGMIVVPQLDRSELTSLVTATGGRYRDISVDDTDLKALLPAANINDEVIMVEREFDLWHDAGYWLLLPILLLALAGFRRGWLMVLMFAVLLPSTPEAEARAFGWKDLWQTADQQGQAAIQKSDYESAASLFKAPEWKGESLFRNQKFEQAAEQFAKTDSARSVYNQGNALAKAGKLQEALKAYDKALEKQPGMEDAEFNRKLVEDLLKQQQDQQNKDQQNKDQQQKDQQQKDQQQQDQQNKDQQQKDQQQQDQQNKDQQNKDQQQKDQQQKDQDQSDQQQSGQEQNKDQQQSESENAQNQEDSSEQSSEQQNSEQQNAEKQEKNAAQQTDEQEQPDNQEEAARQTQVEQDDSAQSPEKQAVESWLRTIPDDPGGLLRRKFMQQQQIRQQSGQGR